MTSLYKDIIWANTSIKYTKLNKPIMHQSSRMKKV